MAIKRTMRGACSNSAIVFISTHCFLLLVAALATVDCDTDIRVRQHNYQKNNTLETTTKDRISSTHSQDDNVALGYANSAQEQPPRDDNIKLETQYFRLKRASGVRGRQSRVPLAQRPPKSTTSTTTSTSTTTTTSTSTASSNDEQPTTSADVELDESSGDSGDYEELISSKSKTKSKSKSSTTSTTTAKSNEEEVDEEEQEEEEEEITTTTTTTQRSTTGRRLSGGEKAIRKTTSKGKSTTSTTSERPPVKQSKAKNLDVSAEREPEMRSNSSSSSSELVATTEAEPNSQHHLHHQQRHRKKTPLVSLPFIRPKNMSVCIPEAYLEFPRDLIVDKWRSRGLIIVHVFVICYMFYSLALVCERYFMPSLEEFAQRLQISEDVAGATLMSAGSSAPELFTAILGVFVAKGDVGTGAIVGSAVFNILFVIGLCAFVSTTTTQLQWWPVLRDSVYYTLTVLVLILIIYDERVTALESGFMICLYGVYIVIMAHNEQLKEATTRQLLAYPLTAKLISHTNSITIEGPDDVFGGGSSSSATAGGKANMQMKNLRSNNNHTPIVVEEDSIFLAAALIIVRHKRLFRSQLRFQSAARYIIVKRQHRVQLQKQSTAATNSQMHEEVNYFGPESEPLAMGSTSPGSNSSGAGSHSKAQRAKMEAYARSSTLSKNKFSIVSKDDYEFWHRPPQEGENYYLWLAKIPVNYVLHYTIPDPALYPDKYVLAFVISICWTAFFSYIMVWMVTIIGYTLGIPDSVMGVTFLAAGTSVPDCYSSIHAARNGMADMAVSNSIGSNVFDILIGLAVPWFIQSAIYPGVVATINSRGVIYSVILLFLSLVVTIYLMNRSNWNLEPRLGLALILAYAVFIILTCMLEFNLFGHVNPPPCPPPAGSADY